LVTDIL
jgi:endonuclease YncB( thermonuclease family)